MGGSWMPVCDSDSEEAAVDGERDAGDVARHVGCQEDTGPTRSSVWPTRPMGIGVMNDFEPLGVLARRCSHRRLDHAGGERVDAHAERRELCASDCVSILIAPLDGE